MWCAVISVNKQLTVFRNFFCDISRLCRETAKRDFLISSVPARNITHYTTVFISNHQQRFSAIKAISRLYKITVGNIYYDATIVMYDILYWACITAERRCWWLLIKFVYTRFKFVLFTGISKTQRFALPKNNATLSSCALCGWATETGPASETEKWKHSRNCVKTWFLKLPRLRPFVLLAAACAQRWVWSNCVVRLDRENKYWGVGDGVNVPRSCLCILNDLCVCVPRVAVGRPRRETGDWPSEPCDGHI
jgi:hypothetical protein